MRSFLIAWAVAFGLVAAVASGIGWYVGRTVPPPAPGVAQSGSDVEAAPPFHEADALRVVSMRLPAGASGEHDRQQLELNATVTYHSPQHWRVCFDGACWVAHGPGRYAEAENEAARQREAAPRLAP